MEIVARFLLLIFGAKIVTLFFMLIFGSFLILFMARKFKVECIYLLWVAYLLSFVYFLD